MLLSRALRIRPKEVVAFVGAGGKTTAMFRFASELTAEGWRVITTTTTHLLLAQARQAPHHLIYSPATGETERDIVDRVQAFFSDGEGGQLLITGPEVEEGRVGSVPPGLIDRLIEMEQVDAIINEADGSRRRPFKAPASYEPALSNSTTVLVPVAGLGVLGRPLTDEWVHRPEIVSRLAGVQLGDPITPEVLARVLAHPAGGLKGRPKGARAVVLLNQVENEAQMEGAEICARLLLRNAAVDAVAIGAVAESQEPVREAYRRVVAVVMSAGAGTRMQGRIKPLLPWRGRTLVENAIQAAADSSVSETVLVLGSHADEIRARIGETPARVILNLDWEEGHASTVRAGLRSLAAETDAALFVNVDQPWLTAGVIDAILKRYRETDAPIVAPRFAGRRGNPVLFNRSLWPELGALQGEQGGRVLLDAHAGQVEWVEFDDARPAEDVDTVEEYDALVRRQSVQGGH